MYVFSYSVGSCQYREEYLSCHALQRWFKSKIVLSWSIRNRFFFIINDECCKKDYYGIFVNSKAFGRYSF